MKHFITILALASLIACSGKKNNLPVSNDSTSTNLVDSLHAESVFLKLWFDEEHKPTDVKAVEQTITKYDSVCNDVNKIQVAYNAKGEIVKLALQTKNETGELLTLSNQYYKNQQLFYIENLADVLPDPQSSIVFKGFVTNNAIEKILIAKTMDVNGVLVDYPEIRPDQIEFVANPVEKINENKPHPVNHDYVGE